MPLPDVPPDFPPQDIPTTTTDGVFSQNYDSNGFPTYEEDPFADLIPLTQYANLTLGPTKSPSLKGNLPPPTNIPKNGLPNNLPPPTFVKPLPVNLPPPNTSTLKKGLPSPVNLPPPNLPTNLPPPNLPTNLPPPNAAFKKPAGVANLPPPVFTTGTLKGKVPSPVTLPPPNLTVSKQAGVANLPPPVFTAPKGKLPPPNSLPAANLPLNLPPPNFIRN